MAPWIFQVLMMMTLSFISCCLGKRDPLLYCSACTAIVDELKFSISQVDPKKTISVGGFRLDPDGTMRDKKVLLARSETHLSELLDQVCSRMEDYALYLDPDSNQNRYRRFAPRTGDSSFPDLQNFKFDGPEASKDLKFACETVVEELEDAIMSLFSQEEQEDVQEELCSRLSGLCGAVGRDEL